MTEEDEFEVMIKSKCILEEIRKIDRNNIDFSTLSKLMENDEELRKRN